MFVQVTAKNVGGVFYETQCSSGELNVFLINRHRAMCTAGLDIHVCQQQQQPVLTERILWLNFHSRNNSSLLSFFDCFSCLLVCYLKVTGWLWLVQLAHIINQPHWKKIRDNKESLHDLLLTTTKWRREAAQNWTLHYGPIRVACLDERTECLI